MEPERSIALVFAKAREFAPCYLVFEDLDSIVNDRVRSYFLNEVDGLKSNDGILMVGSTNHLDRLDPGISKRPSRFDRKYYFPDPDYEQRVQYAKYWQGKLKDNDTVEFPDDLCPAIAKITEKGEDPISCQNMPDWHLHLGGPSQERDMKQLSPALTHLIDRALGKDYKEAAFSDAKGDVHISEESSNRILRMYFGLDEDQKQFMGCTSLPFGQLLVSGCPGPGRPVQWQS